MSENGKTYVFPSPPEDFRPVVLVAACYVEWNGKLLFVRRAKGSLEAGLWGVPAGKSESGETALDRAVRELQEETGIQSKPQEWNWVGSLYIRTSKLDYTYEMFRLVVSQCPEVFLNRENDDYLWIAPHEVETLPSIQGGKATFLRYSQATCNTKKQASSFVNSYLILRRPGQVLLGLRYNTGYGDEMWGLPAGHVEEGESATEGMAREALEELGICIDPQGLLPVHVMHRQSNRLNVDLFFSCDRWKGNVENKEPRKCAELSFFSMDGLPFNLISYVRRALDLVEKNVFYSEVGWE